MSAVHEAAADWFARRRRGLTDTEAAGLAAWLDADPANGRALQDQQTAWRDVEAMRDDPAIMAMRQEAMRPRFTPPRRLIAASLALAVLGTAALWGADAFWPGKHFSNQVYRTGIGQRATVTLPDGSQVILNTDSVVRTRAANGRRLIYLDRGQAYFKVARDAQRPFVVTAGGRTITALGTAFDVRVDDGRTFKVTLVEGKVRVEAKAPAPVSDNDAPAPMQAIEMTAGAQLRAAPDDAGRWNLTPADVQRETSWTTGKLVFYSAPLTEVVAELNRYSEKKIVLEGGGWTGRPISGAFRAGDVDAFAEGLETYRMAKVEEDGSDLIRLGPP